MARRPVALASTLVLMLSAGIPGAQAAAGVKLTAVDKVYAQAERSLLKLGVYHLKTTTITTLGKSTGRSTDEQWIDVPEGAERSVSTQISSAYYPGTPGSTSTELLAHNIQWGSVPSGGGLPSSPQTCHQVTPATADLLGCPYSDLKESSAIVPGHWRGRKVIVLVVRTTVFGDSATVRLTTRTYLDPATALPLAAIATGTYESQQKTRPLHISTSYHGQRISRASLSKNFFNPASLGWKVPNPLKGLPHGIPVYWPGQTWTPGGALPAVTLQSVDKLPATSRLYQEILQYALASDPYGPTVLSLQLWKAKDWAKANVGEPVPLCKPVSRATLALGTVTFRCPDDGVDGPFGDIDAPGAHITIDAPSFQSGPKVTFSPFATIPALETVLNALQVRP